MSKVLVTGADGFIGQHVCRIFTMQGHDVYPIGNETNLAQGFWFREPVDVVVNLASNSHVDHSIVAPVPFIQNNVNLTLNMLEYARAFPPSMFIQFSTDEVYGPAPDGITHKEWSPIVPSNPYAASKAAQEAIAVSYWRTYGIPLVLTNTMNVYGPGQGESKFIPMAIRRIREGRTVPIHAEYRSTTVGNTTITDGGWEAGSRYWIYVKDVADALLHIMGDTGLVLEYPRRPRPVRYNIVGEQEIENDRLARIIGQILGVEPRLEYVDFHASRPGHDRRYALDGSRLAEDGWTPQTGIRDGLRATVNAREGVPA